MGILPGHYPGKLAAVSERAAEVDHARAIDVMAKNG
jgi:hypothetical protein